MNHEPPQDGIAEQSVLGGMLLSATAVTDVLEIVKASDFYSPKHQHIFSAIVDLFAAGDPADTTTVAAELQERGYLAKIGGATYLLELTQVVPSPASAAYYAKIVRDKARLRYLVETGIRWQQLGNSDTTGGEDVDAVLGEAEKFLREIQEPTTGVVELSDLIDEWRDWIANDDDIIPLPWPELNDYLGGGLRPGKLYVIAARPGEGKSLMGLNILTHAAENTFSSLMFSLEMDRKEVASRILAGGSWSDYGEIFRRNMTRETWARVNEYIDTNKDMALKFNHQTNLNVEQIAAVIRSEKPKVALVDYCQLVRATDKKSSRHNQVEHVSRTLKICAGEVGAAIILISQVNRDPGKGGGRMPTMEDLREGGIENDADLILTLFRPETDTGIVKVGVAKNRDGKNGTLEMVFRGHLARIG